jgi:hypothetical protein
VKTDRAANETLERRQIQHGSGTFSRSKIVRTIGISSKTEGGNGTTTASHLLKRRNVQYNGLGENFQLRVCWVADDRRVRHDASKCPCKMVMLLTPAPIWHGT